MTEYAIEIRGLEKNLKGFDLGPMDLKIPRGSIVGFIGENGAGKSTTIKLILGLLKKDLGQIKIFGNSDYKSLDIKNKIGVVFDDLMVPEELSLKDIEKFSSRVYKNWDKETFYQLCNYFTLKEKQKIKTYSRGMRMKLSIAMALSHQADLLILDEATSGLDPIIRDKILDLILDFMQDENHTVFISSHILSDLEKIADYIAFINKGKILFFESIHDLEEKYALASLSNEEVKAIDKDAIVGKRSHAFGQDLLVKRELVPDFIKLEKASIEDIMIYFKREDER